MQRLLIALLLSLASMHASAMTGDEKAITMARRLVDNMGGAEAWAKANWIYAREDARYAARPGAFNAEFWRRTDTPAEWARISGPNFSRAYAWTEDGGWRTAADGTRAYTKEEMQDNLGWRRGEIYVMYVRFARNDPNLRLIAKDDRSFRAVDARDGSDLGLFGVDSNGELKSWTYGFGDDRVEYVYGPLKKFGKISMPAWGTLTSGEFRFFYTDVRIQSAAPNVDFAMPSAP